MTKQSKQTIAKSRDFLTFFESLLNFQTTRSFSFLSLTCFDLSQSSADPKQRYQTILRTNISVKTHILIFYAINFVNFRQKEFEITKLTLAKNYAKVWNLSQSYEGVFLPFVLFCNFQSGNAVIGQLSPETNKNRLNPKSGIFECEVLKLTESVKGTK